MALTAVLTVVGMEATAAATGVVAVGAMICDVLVWLRDEGKHELCLVVWDEKASERREKSEQEASLYPFLLSQQGAVFASHQAEAQMLLSL